VLLIGKVDPTSEFIDVEVAYTHSKKSKFGRWYASWPSLQNCPGYIRRMCSVGIYADVDIKNCFPEILLQIAMKNGILTPCLQEYVTNREAWANKICADLSISFKQVKNAVLISMHGGNYKRATEQKSHSTLDAFAMEVKNIGEELRVLPEYTQLWANAESAQKEKTGFDNPMGTFISYLCQIQEAAIIGHVKDYFEQKGLKTGCIVFDGCMVFVNSPNDVSSDMLCSAADYAFEKTGYRIELVVKSLEPTHEDLAKVQPCPAPPQQDLPATFAAQLANLNPQQKLILFSSGTLGRGGALRPGIESLKELQVAGYAIGIWNDEENIPLQNMVDLHFSVLLTKDDCATSSLAMNVVCTSVRSQSASCFRTTG